MEVIYYAELLYFKYRYDHRQSDSADNRGICRPQSYFKQKERQIILRLRLCQLRDEGRVS